MHTFVMAPQKKRKKEKKEIKKERKEKKSLMGPSWGFFSFLSPSAMEIRAGQRPPRSKPEDQTSLSASTGLLGKCWKVFFRQTMEKNKDMMMMKNKKNKIKN